jgi:hypothetical protein
MGRKGEAGGGSKGEWRWWRSFEWSGGGEVRIYYEILEFFGGLDLFDLRRVCFVGLAEEAPPILIYHGGGWGRPM